MLTTTRYIFITALRDWLFPGLLGVALVAMAIANFLGGTAVAEQWQMAAAYMAGTVRVIITGGMVIFICFHVRRMFESREVEVILTRPISRAAFVVAYWMGFAAISCGLVIPIAIAMWFFLPINITNLLYWALSMQCEALLLIAFALFCSLMLKSAVLSVVLSFAFYAVARMMGFFLYLFETPINDSALIHYTAKMLQLLSYVLPRLDFCAKSAWLIYGAGDDAYPFLFAVQTLVYVPLILTMAVYDFKRKQF